MRSSIEEICLADYGELDAAERDLLLALIQSSASGLEASADASSPAKEPPLPRVQAMKRRLLPPEADISPLSPAAAQQSGSHVELKLEDEHGNTEESPARRPGVERGARHSTQAHAQPRSRNISSTANFIDVPSHPLQARHRQKANIKSREGKTLEHLTLDQIIKKYKECDAKVHDIEHFRLMNLRDKLQVAKKSADVLATCRYEEKIAYEQDRTRALNVTKRGVELQMDYYLENRMSYGEQVRRTIVTWQLERKAAAKAALGDVIAMNHAVADGNGATSLTKSLVKRTVINAKRDLGELVEEMGALKLELGELKRRVA